MTTPVPKEEQRRRIAPGDAAKPADETSAHTIARLELRELAAADVRGNVVAELEQWVARFKLREQIMACMSRCDLTPAARRVLCKAVDRALFDGRPATEALLVVLTGGDR